MSILLIGGKSTLSTTLKSYLEKKKIKYQESNRYPDSEIFIDLNDINTFDNIPKNIDKSIIFAGITNIDICEKQKQFAHKINYLSTVKLVNKLNKQGTKCLIISSSSVFGNKSTRNGEYDKKEPDSYYGKLKSKLEDEVKNNQLNCIIRLTKVILPEMKLIKNWIFNLRINKSITAYNNLLISPISYLSFNKMIYEWIRIGYSGVYHLTSDNQLSYYDLILDISKKLGLNQSLIIPTKGHENLIFKPNKSYLDCNLEYSYSKKLFDELKLISNYYV